MKQPKIADSNKGVTPNTAQRRPGLPKHSPPVPFCITEPTEKK